MSEHTRKISLRLYESCHGCEKFDPDATFSPLEYEIGELDEENQRLHVAVDFLTAENRDLAEKWQNAEKMVEHWKQQAYNASDSNDCLGKELREAEMLLAELRSCGEMMARDLAFARAKKRRNKTTLAWFEALIRNHNDVTERLTKTLRGEEAWCLAELGLFYMFLLNALPE